jgi:hypothetical protein
VNSRLQAEGRRQKIEPIDVFAEAQMLLRHADTGTDLRLAMTVSINRFARRRRMAQAILLSIGLALLLLLTRLMFPNLRDQTSEAAWLVFVIPPLFMTFQAAFLWLLQRRHVSRNRLWKTGLSLSFVVLLALAVGALRSTRAGRLPDLAPLVLCDSPSTYSETCSKGAIRIDIGTIEGPSAFNPQNGDRYDCGVRVMDGEAHGQVLVTKATLHGVCPSWRATYDPATSRLYLDREVILGFNVRSAFSVPDMNPVRSTLSSDRSGAWTALPMSSIVTCTLVWGAAAIVLWSMRVRKPQSSVSRHAAHPPFSTTSPGSLTSTRLRWIPLGVRDWLYVAIAIQSVVLLHLLYCATVEAY